VSPHILVVPSPLSSAHQQQTDETDSFDLNIEDYSPNQNYSTGS
jgi:hypothetical protein